MEDFYGRLLGMDIYKARVLMRNKLSKKLKDFDITGEQWSVLKHVFEKEGCNQKDLAQRCLKDRAALTRILDILEKKSLIKRESSPIDRREFLVFLTDVGKKAFDKISPIMDDMAKENLKGFTDDEINSLQYLLEKLISNLS